MNDEVSTHDAVERCCGVEASVIAVVASEFVECNYGCDDLHGGGRTHPLPMAVGVERTVGGKVVDVEAQLRALKQLVGCERIESLLHLLPQGVERHGRSGLLCFHAGGRQEKQKKERK